MIARIVFVCVTDANAAYSNASRMNRFDFRLLQNNEYKPKE